MSAKYGVDREEVLLPSGSGVRLALGEAEVVSSVEKFLVSQGVCLAAFEEEPKRVVRSKTVILVRNLPVDVSEGDLRGVFGKYGPLGRVVVPEFGVCGVVEFMAEGVAKKAFRAEAYNRFRGVVLFLEWAPVGVFGGAAVVEETAEEEGVGGVAGDKKNVAAAAAPAEEDLLPRVGEELEDLTSPEEGTTLFVKNLSWETREEKVKEVSQI